MKGTIASVLIAFLLIGAPAFAQQPEPTQTLPPKPKPAPKLTFAERMKQFLARTGATVDETKSSAEMIVSNSDARGGKVTIVLVNDRRRICSVSTFITLAV
jgi:hypothetical protein